MVPLWILLTYILFVISPAVAYEIVVAVSGTTEHISTVAIIILILNDCCCGSDVLIYVFLNASVRGRFKRMIKMRNAQVGPAGRRTTLWAINES